MCGKQYGRIILKETQCNYLICPGCQKENNLGNEVKETAFKELSAANEEINFTYDTSLSESEIEMNEIQKERAFKRLIKLRDKEGQYQTDVEETPELKDQDFNESMDEMDGIGKKRVFKRIIKLRDKERQYQTDVEEMSGLENGELKD